MSEDARRALRQFRAAQRRMIRVHSVRAVHRRRPLTLIRLRTPVSAPLPAAPSDYSSLLVTPGPASPRPSPPRTLGLPPLPLLSSHSAALGPLPLHSARLPFAGRPSLLSARLALRVVSGQDCPPDRRQADGEQRPAARAVTADVESRVNHDRLGGSLRSAAARASEPRASVPTGGRLARRSVCALTE